jgi:hypothetical protein
MHGKSQENSKLVPGKKANRSGALSNSDQPLKVGVRMAGRRSAMYLNQSLTVRHQRLDLPRHRHPLRLHQRLG